MAHPEFDATITLNDHHSATAGLSGPEAAAAVRHAVEQMPGAGWIDVEAQPYPPELPGWVIVYPQGRSVTPDTPAWHALRRDIEVMATAALVGAGARTGLSQGTVQK